LLNQLTVCIWTKETSRVGSPLDEAGRLFTRLRAEVGPPSPLALCKEGRIGEQKNPYGSHHQPQHISPTRRLGPFDMSQSVTFRYEPECYLSKTSHWQRKARPRRKLVANLRPREHCLFALGPPSGEGRSCSSRAAHLGEPRVQSFTLSSLTPRPNANIRLHDRDDHLQDRVGSSNPPLVIGER
jgi:hypothetical protein